MLNDDSLIKTLLPVHLSEHLSEFIDIKKLSKIKTIHTKQDIYPDELYEYIITLIDWAYSLGIEDTRRDINDVLFSNIPENSMYYINKINETLTTTKGKTEC